MGRLQTFDSTAVVQSARDVFWDAGFDGASLADLESATGLNRSSLYHAFGSKRGLFDAAVADYLDTVIRPRLRGLITDDAGRDALLAYFDALREAVVAAPVDSPRRGCLLVNAAVGLAAHDEPARAVVEAYRTELTTALRSATLGATAATRGGPAAELAAAELARVEERVRTLASLSLSAMLLARVNREESVALLTTAADQLRAWFPGD